MGRSLHHSLAFGIDLGWDDEREFKIPAKLLDGDEDDESASIDIDNYIAAKAGIPRDDYAARRKAVDTYPIAIKRYGVGDYCGHVVVLRGLNRGGYDGPKAIELPGEPTAADLAALKAFFDDTGLPWSEPKWMTFGLYW